MDMKNNIFNDFQNELARPAIDPKSQAKREKVTPQDGAPESQEQRTRQWFLNRLGKITGSRMPDFMKAGRGGNIWGETCKKVLFQVVAEKTMTESGINMYLDELMKKEYRQTAWGNYYEDFAKDEIEELFGYKIENVGSSFFNDFFGTSPDGKLSDGSPIEIKCPYDPIKHEVNLGLPEKVTRGHEYFWQMQSHIMVTGSDKCHFFSYDPRRNESERIAHMICEQDEAAIDEMKMKLLKAEEIVDNRLKTGKYNFDL